MTSDPFKAAEKAAKAIESLRPIDRRPATERASAVHLMALELRGLTEERYRCDQCGHRGEARKHYTDQHHGDGAWETIWEPMCENCGSPFLQAINEE